MKCEVKQPRRPHCSHLTLSYLLAVLTDSAHREKGESPPSPQRGAVAAARGLVSAHQPSPASPPLSRAPEMSPRQPQLASCPQLFTPAPHLPSHSFAGLLRPHQPSPAQGPQGSSCSSSPLHDQKTHPFHPPQPSPPPSPHAPCPLLHCLVQLKVLCSVLLSSRPCSLTTRCPQHCSRHFGAVGRPASSSQSALGKQHWDRARPRPVPRSPPSSQQ